jgi:hypothetical protein
MQRNNLKKQNVAKSRAQTHAKHPEMNPTSVISLIKINFRIIVLYFLVLILALCFIVPRLYPSNKQVTPVNTYMSQSFNPISTLFIPRPRPIVKGWKIYTDTYGNFSFELPDFMPEPVIYSRGETDPNYISVYDWHVLNNEQYDHYIKLNIIGPYKDTASVDLVNWMKEQYKQYQVGVQDVTGGKIITSNLILDNKKAIQSVFQQENSEIVLWDTFFKSSSGIYNIRLQIQESDNDISSYQTIFDHIISTFKFIK